MSFALVLRGHVRDGFKNNNLNVFIDFLFEKMGKFDIFIQTWNNIEAKKGHSWRELDDINIKITNEKIMNYFSRKNLIKHILILDDSNIDNLLHGSTDGKIKNTLANKKGWKYMWYGKYMIAKMVKDENKYAFVINTRLDFFGKQLFQFINNKVLNTRRNKFLFVNRLISNHDIDFKILFTKILLYFRTHEPVFQFEAPRAGIDNFYIASVGDNYKIARLFHYHLDPLIDEIMNTNHIHQESMVLLVGRNLKKYTRRLLLS